MMKSLPMHMKGFIAPICFGMSVGLVGGGMHRLFGNDMQMWSWPVFSLYCLAAFLSVFASIRLQAMATGERWPCEPYLGWRTFTGMFLMMAFAFLCKTLITSV